MVKILACQVAVPNVTSKAQRNDHVAKVARCISENLALHAADLVVLPELSTISYSREAFANLNELAESLEDETVRTFSEVSKAHNTTICFGMPRRDDRGRYFISQVVVGPDGSCMGHFDKLHMAQVGQSEIYHKKVQFGASMEKEYFTKGEGLFLFTVGGLKVAPIICYDLRFPELTQTLCLKHGVDVILHSVAFFRDDTYASWHSFAVTRALENQVFFVSLNRAGPGFGHSIFCPPWVSDMAEVTHFGEGEVFLELEVSPQRLDDARKEYSFRTDRRGDYDTMLCISK